MLYIFLLSLVLFGQTGQTDSVSVESTVESATVYLSGARVERSAAVSLKQGINQIAFADLPASLNEETVQLFSGANIIIRGVSFKNMAKAGDQYEKKLNQLKSKKERIENKLDEKKTKLLILKKKMGLLAANQDLTQSNSSISFGDLKKALDFLGEQFAEIVQKKAAIKKQKQKIHEKLEEVKDKIQRIKYLRNQSSGVIHAEIYSPKEQQITLHLNYVVRDAFWYPTYSLLDGPLKLIYKANIHQSTGVDWENVQLAISSAKPKPNTSLPSINPVYLSFYEPPKLYSTKISAVKARSVRPARANGISTVTGFVRSEQGEPLIGANVSVVGTGIGAATNSNGRFTVHIPPQAKFLRVTYIGFKTKTVPIYSSTMNITLQAASSKLGEVVVTAFGSPVRTSVQPGQTTFTIALNKPYTVKSGNTAKTVTIATHSLKADYQYFAIPKKREKAYLTAKITGWNDLHLLPGDANLYVSKAYVGSTHLDFNTARDTLQLTLGDDNDIIVKRTQIKGFSEKNFFGNKVTETKGWTISLKNTKNEPVEIKVIDQIPVSRNEDIEISLTKRSGATYDSKTGKLTWVLDLSAGETQKVTFTYEIKYPDDKKIEKGR